jgi:imidazole glycerol-phosphate synthase subunit HisH
MIIIIDYGLGNLGSVENMFRRIGADAKISSNADDILAADKLILPGVGSFDNGMSKINALGFTELLHEKVIQRKTPILGICLGMQLMTQSSEEGKMDGLGWFDAETLHFDFEDSSSFKVPHMGWNEISPYKKSVLLQSLPEPSKFYFVHSYYVKANKKEDILATCKHNIEFTCALERENIFATQFHPEKSHKYGIKLFENFALI